MNGRITKAGTKNAAIPIKATRIRHNHRVRERMAGMCELGRTLAGWRFYGKGGENKDNGKVLFTLIVLQMLARFDR